MYTMLCVLLTPAHDDMKFGSFSCFVKKYFHAVAPVNL